MLNAFHSSAPLRFFCAVALAWPLALFALFLAIAWFPSDPYSAAGDLSWINPTIVAAVAMVGSIHCLLITVPSFGRRSLGQRWLAISPVVLTSAAIVITYVRA